MTCSYLVDKGQGGGLPKVDKKFLNVNIINLVEVVG